MNNKKKLTNRELVRTVVRYHMLSTRPVMVLINPKDDIYFHAEEATPPCVNKEYKLVRQGTLKRRKAKFGGRYSPCRICFEEAKINGIPLSEYSRDACRKEDNEIKEYFASKAYQKRKEE